MQPAHDVKSKIKSMSDERLSSAIAHHDAIMATRGEFQYSILRVHTMLVAEYDRRENESKRKR